MPLKNFLLRILIENPLWFLLYSYLFKNHLETVIE